MSNPLVIYHANCLDGFTAAWAVWKALGDDATYLAASYGEPIPPESTTMDRDVIVVDFSYSFDEMMALANNSKSVTVLDHHATAQAALLPLLSSKIISGEFDMDRSGAAMAWDHYHPKKKRPVLVDAVQDRDLWRFELTNTRAFMACLALVPKEFAAWDDFADRIKSQRDAVISSGLLLLEKHDRSVKKYVNGTKLRLNIGGHLVLAANIPAEFASDVGNGLAEDRDQAFGASFTVRHDGVSFSLRSTAYREDVSKIAEGYGGGGHRNAAGFHVPHDHFFGVMLSG